MQPCRNSAHRGLFRIGIVKIILQQILRKIKIVNRNLSAENRFPIGIRQISSVFRKRQVYGSAFTLNISRRRGKIHGNFLIFSIHGNVSSIGCTARRINGIAISTPIREAPCIPRKLPRFIALSISGQLDFCILYICPIFSKLKRYRPVSGWIRLQICDDLVILAVDRIFPLTGSYPYSSIFHV